jgi:hypothetical protein
MTLIAGMTTAQIVVMAIGMALTVASLAISLVQMLTYKAPEPPVPPPQAISFIPTAEQGKAIPVVFGTRIVTQPNVVWWGHPHAIKNQIDPSEMQ